jgi:hypothetical protein
MTTAPPLNPFRPTRWEHQRDGYQLIWFTKTAELLAAEKSTYVRGSRGSGKTTLLKSICWEDLSKNTSLRMQRSLADFHHIGVYIRFPDHISNSISFEAWGALYPSAIQPELEFHRFFSLLIELTCAERALTACHELRLSKFALFSAGQELRLVEEVISEFPKLASFADEKPKTFADAARAMRSLVRRINEATGRGDAKRLNEELPGREPGEFLSFIAGRLSDCVRIVSSQGGQQPGFKFCLDDCEVLSALQQRSLNTLVRTSAFPVSWVVSAVGALFDSTETFIDQQPLTDADRRVISLDKRKDEDFRELCQAVASLRLLFSVSEEARNEHGQKPLAEFFPLDSRFGRRDVNDMMSVIARRSTSPLAKHVIRESETLRETLIKSSRRQRSRYARTETLPLYETYILLLWQGREDAFKVDLESDGSSALSDAAKLFDSPSFEAWLRRKQRAALLQFSAKLGFRRLPLAGVGVIVSLADGSIRDFLEILGAVYESYARRHRLDSGDIHSLDRFATARTQIGSDIQTEGIYSASEAYVAGISARTERSSDIVLRMLDGLGHYTSALQSNPDDPTVLGRSERGVFSVRFGSSEQAYSGDVTPYREGLVWRTIRQAEIAGYVRTADLRFGDGGELHENPDSRGRVVTFRLHRRFAPQYRFSYRGAYEAVAISPLDLWPLCDPAVPADPKAWADQMSRRVASFDAQLSLQFPLDAFDE